MQRVVEVDWTCVATVVDVAAACLHQEVQIFFTIINGRVRFYNDKVAAHRWSYSKRGMIDVLLP